MFKSKSKSKRQHDKIGSDISSNNEVNNKEYTYNNKRLKSKRIHLKNTTVNIKLSTDKSDDTPDNKRATEILFIDIGDNMLDDVESGAYKVQPKPFPNSIQSANMIIINDNNNKYKLKLFTTGNNNSEVIIIMGIK